MKKNDFFKRTLFAVLLLMVSSLMWAADFEVDGIAYNILSDTEVEVTSKDNSYKGQVVIPSSVTYERKRYNVTSIGYKAFFCCYSLTSIVIPNSVTNIGELAFGWDHFTSIKIPNGVTSIERAAFYQCSFLTSVVIPNSVTSIGKEAFIYCSSLTSITIPNSVTNIGQSAFKGCSSLTSIKIPNSVTSIEYGVFFDCSALTSVEIPNSVTSIGKSAFCRCSSLTSIEIPNSVTSMADHVFSECSSLTSIEIPNSVTSIGWNTFKGCSSLASVEIPNSVTRIYTGAFSGCSSLTSVICHAEKTPYVVNVFPDVEDVFKDVPQSEATLYVPASALEAYKTAYPWKDFGTILPIGGDVTDMKAEIKALYEKAMELYHAYLFYSEGEGWERYQKMVLKQKENEILAQRIQTEFDVSRDEVEKRTYKVLYPLYTSLELAEIFTFDFKDEWNRGKDELLMLAEENSHILEAYPFYSSVLNHTKDIAAYYDKLKEYKERIEMAVSAEDLSILIEEIKKAMASIESSYLVPIEKEYQAFDQTERRLEDIAWEMDYPQERLNDLLSYWNDHVKELFADRIKELYTKAKALYESYLFYCEGEGWEYYQKLVGKQMDNEMLAQSVKALLEDNRARAVKYTYEKLSSQYSEEDIAAWFAGNIDNECKMINDSIWSLVKENDAILEPYQIFSSVPNHAKDIAAGYNKLLQYKERFDTATSAEEISALIEEVRKDMEIIESSYLIPIQKEYQSLAQTEERLMQIEDSLMELGRRLRDLFYYWIDRIDGMVPTGIEDSINTDADDEVTVYDMKGVARIMKGSNVKNLPKGIYIINGKKVYMQ